MMRIPSVLVGCLVAASFSPVVHAQDAPDIVTIASKAGTFNTLLTAAKAAGLAGTLQNDGPFTVFAPTDDAFAKLPEGTIPALLKDKEALAAILKYHVVAGTVPAAKVVEMSWAETLNGQSVRIQTGENGVQIDDARVVKADIMAKNGVIHVVDSVILPRKNIVETASEAGSFGTLLTAAKAAGLAEVLGNEGPFTVFAPTDEAFAKLPEGTIPALLKDKEKLAAILKYHVVPARVLAGDLPMPEGDAKSASLEADTVLGQKVEIVTTKTGATVNGANIVATDVIAGNGIIHVIDTVILPKN